MTLSMNEFDFVSALVRREAAIVLDRGKEYLVEARLLPLARKAGVATVSEFVAAAQRCGSATTAALIVDAMTTNETSWYRDREPFTALTDQVLPALLPQRTNRVLRVWSAACSSGQEPYTLAMVLEDSLPAGWTYQIVATDISPEMLARAEAGRFSQLEMNRGLPVSQLVRYFERAGTEWQVSAELRRKITFQKVNLAAALPAMQPFDVVFLRNVLIYFDMETKRSVLGRVRALMRPDAWLFLGSAETTIGIREDFERMPAGRTSAYRMRGAPPVAVPAQAGPVQTVTANAVPPRHTPLPASASAVPNPRPAPGTLPLPARPGGPTAPTGAIEQGAKQR